jgi:hypothetical protein
MSGHTAQVLSHPITATSPPEPEPEKENQP